MSTLTTPSVAPRPTTQTLARTLRLFQLFRVEQTDPDRFYTALAEDSVQQLSEFIDLRDRVVIDVGSGPGYFAAAFDAAGARYLGVDFARRRFRRKHGREPKNRFGESLFAYTASTTIRWARRQRDTDIVAVFPRYHPRWLHWIARVPVAREVATWNLAVVLRKRDPSRATDR